ncbi:transaldolase family protein [Fundidesulfovibrio soli]|uniref:transaldolase family protein n=1 Tax=Fundidesulfovibrio soli TaxID=2922716 RepID=UPI001FAEF967|nr:transaldolase family protein [Fundidesulfovibrio soli]
MRPDGLKTRIFLDSGDPAETRQILDLIGFLDGQTTNPSLIAKNPEAKERKAKGRPFDPKEVWAFYRSVVGEISGLIPEGSVSIEVYADAATGTERMLEQVRECSTWIPNAHIKLPTNAPGLLAAKQATAAGHRVNMTLCFSQSQAAAVYAATRGAAQGQVFVSPFIGRLDDRGENGMDLIANILRMFKAGDGHVQVLTASVRTLDHFLCALALQSDIITAPFSLIRAWGQAGMPIPGKDFVYDSKKLAPIPYREISLKESLESYDTVHDLTDAGMAKFSADWNALMGQ